LPLPVLRLLAETPGFCTVQGTPFHSREARRHSARIRHQNPKLPTPTTYPYPSNQTSTTHPKKTEKPPPPGTLKPTQAERADIPKTGQKARQPHSPTPKTAKKILKKKKNKGIR
jgi:hypothetical protein